MPQQTQNPDPSDTTQTTPPQPDPSDSTPETPVTPPQPAGDSSILQAYTQQLLTESRERARLQRELDDLKSRQNAPKPPTPEEEKEFFDKPKSVVRELIQDEIRQAIQPLNQYAAQQQRITLIETFKAQMRANNSQFPYIDRIESIFDNILASSPTVDANSVVAAYNLALGSYISQGGRLETTQPPPNNPPNRGNPPVPSVPPHVSPTPPAAPPARGKKTLRALSEAEKKIARFNRMTDEEYIIWTEGVDAREVAHVTDEQLKERMK